MVPHTRLSAGQDAFATLRYVEHVGVTGHITNQMLSPNRSASTCVDGSLDRNSACSIAASHILRGKYTFVPLIADTPYKKLIRL